jgi:hypothetical protein
MTLLADRLSLLSGMLLVQVRDDHIGSGGGESHRQFACQHAATTDDDGGPPRQRKEIFNQGVRLGLRTICGLHWNIGNIHN